MKYATSAKLLIAALAGCMLVACSNKSHETQPPAQNHYVNAGHHVLGLSQLQRLARKGDADAQYALGYRFYYGIGVKQDQSKSLTWLSQSASQGQIQARQALALIHHAVQIDRQHAASNQLNAKKPLQVASKVVSPSEGFTLQLMGTHDKKSLVDFILANHLQNKATYYRRSFDSQDWYVLVSGRFATQNEAMAAINTLPDTVRKMNPWVKPLGLVKKEMQG